MLRIHYVLLFSYLIYFCTLVTGLPQITSAPPAEVEQISSFSGENPEFEYNRNGDPGDSGSQAVEADSLISKFLMSRSALTALNDPLLENDSRPNQLNRAIERELIGNLFWLILISFWCVAILLSMAALMKRHWFYQNMFNLIFIPSLLFIFFSFISTGREIISESIMDDVLINYAALGRSYIEISLLFLGIFLLFQNFLPTNSRLALTETTFMAHLNLTNRNDNEVASQNPLSALFQLLIILVSAVLIANLLLLPFFILQLSFPDFFLILPLVISLVLAYYYSSSYLKVSQAQHAEGGFYSGLSFLGFRILRNSFFLVGAIILVLLAASVVVAVTMLNIDFLQSIQVLKRPEVI